MRGGRPSPRRVAAAAAGLVLALAATAGAQNVGVRGVDSLHVRANVQPQFDTTTVDGVDASSEWLLRRARLGIRAFAAGWIRGDVEADFGRGRAQLTDAVVGLDFDDRFRIRAGQYKKPFDALELTSSRELLVIERDGTPRGADGPTPNGLVGGLGYSDRDIGIEWSGDFGRWGATVGVFNGSGSNTSDDDGGKQLAARVAVEVAEGWEVAGGWTANRLDLVVEGDQASVDEWVQAVEVALVGGEYAEPGPKALVQAMFGDNHDVDLGGGLDATFAAVQGIVAWHVPVYDVPYVIGIEPAVRVGWADPDTDADAGAATLWTAGVNLYHHERVKTQAGVDVLSPSEGDAEAAFRLHLVLGF